MDHDTYGNDAFGSIDTMTLHEIDDGLGAVIAAVGPRNTWVRTLLEVQREIQEALAVRSHFDVPHSCRDCAEERIVDGRNTGEYWCTVCDARVFVEPAGRNADDGTCPGDDRIMYPFFS